MIPVRFVSDSVPARPCCALPRERRCSLEVLGETICPYCGVGCRLRLEGDRQQGRPHVARIRGVETAAANLGGICAKGAQLGPTLDTPDRLTRPQLRLSRHDEFRPADWDTALAYVAEVFTNILHTHGPGAVAFYGSGQLDTETAYLATKLFKGHLGCNNTDSNSRLCMAAAVAGYRSSLGSDGPPCCYDDIDEADLVLVMGSNMAEAHPVTFDRLRAARKRRPDLRLVVVDPRRTATAKAADLHLPVAPGGDIALLNALGRLLLLQDAFDEPFVARHTNGFAEYRRFLLAQDPGELRAAAGVSEADLARCARLIAAARAFLSFYCMGLNQSTVGMWKNNSLINLHLLTGQIGKPGAGPFSLTGQPNAMGGREAGLLSHQLPGYRTVEDPEHRAAVEAAWGRAPGSIDPKPGLTAVEMFRALEKGQLQAIWIAATNPAVSLPDLHQVHRGLACARLVVVSDAYHPTETTRRADVLLPAAQWGEKAWTSTNSERTISHSPQLFDPPGEALPDWQIVARFARILGYDGFSYSSNAEVWDEFIRLTAGRPCDMAGVTSARLRAEDSVQWPCPSPDHAGSKRRYLDRRFATPDGRANFLPRDHREPREPPDHEFPFVLTTGRLYAHWHTLTRTGKAEKLVRREPAPFVEVHPDDAERLGLRDGELGQLSSRRGTIQLPVRVSDGVVPGMLFVPFHWGDLFGEGNAANYLTISAIGRVAKQPELKFCAVNLEKVMTGAEVVPTPAALCGR
ncbi:MAG: molybdopterin-dependent oxidoreductase [Planctomycetes bacterium]|nr:molybdopterin-dependent oxidoreductase [Planctomycetota bacterium]